MFDKERKSRLEKSSKIKSEDAVTILQKLYGLLSESKSGDIHLDKFDLRFSFAEVKLGEGREVGVIESIPSSFDEIFSLSFDIFIDQKKEREIIFDREGMRMFPFDNRGIEKEILASIKLSK
jgi:hypothetical protein